MHTYMNESVVDTEVLLVYNSDSQESVTICVHTFGWTLYMGPRTLSTNLLRRTKVSKYYRNKYDGHTS